MRTRHSVLWALALVVGAIGAARGEDLYGLKEGNLELQSAGPLAFGPAGILLVGDVKGATVYAVATGDTKGDASKVTINIPGLDGKLAAALGVAAGEVQLNDLVVNPLSGSLYASITAAGKPVLARIGADGAIAPLSLTGVAHSKSVLPNPPASGQDARGRDPRQESITDIAFVDGTVLVSGRSSEQSPSNVRALAFPFADADPGTAIEIYHGNHGKLEDNAVVRTFVPFMINGQPNVLAGFTCTPLVKIPLSSLESGKKVRGTTVAELGNRNVPLDMIAYKRGGKDYLLMANSVRGVMKISTDDLARDTGITERVGGVAGQSYETIEALANTVQLDRLNDTHAVVVVKSDSGLDLRTVDLP